MSGFLLSLNYLFYVLAQRIMLYSYQHNRSHVLKEFFKLMNRLTIGFFFLLNER